MYILCIHIRLSIKREKEGCQGICLGTIFFRKMPKRKFDVRLRKVGNSYVVTIPKDTIDRFELKEGDFVAIELDTEEIIRSDTKKSEIKKSKGDKIWYLIQNTIQK